MGFVGSDKKATPLLICFYCLNANEIEPGARVGQSVHCDVCIRLEMLMLC